MSFFLKPVVIKIELFLIFLIILSFSLIHCYGLQSGILGGCTSFESLIAQPWVDFSDMNYYFEDMLLSVLFLIGVVIESLIFAFFIGWIIEFIRQRYFEEEEDEENLEYEKIKGELDKKIKTKKINLGAVKKKSMSKTKAPIKKMTSSNSLILKAG